MYMHHSPSLARARAMPPGTARDIANGKRTVKHALDALQARIEDVERERTEAIERASVANARATALERAVDALARAMASHVAEGSADARDARNAIEDVKRDVEQVKALCENEFGRTRMNETKAREARREAREVERIASECVKFTREVKREFLAKEDAVNKALAHVKALEMRECEREKALEEARARAEDCERALREEIECVRNASARAEAAWSKGEEISGLAGDVRELARWSKANAEHQNRRLARLERETSNEARVERERELESSVSATALAMKAQHARLQQLEERGVLRASRDAAFKADIDVLKKSLGEHHEALMKMCRTFDTELDLDERAFPTSSAFVRTKSFNT